MNLSRALTPLFLASLLAGLNAGCSTLEMVPAPPYPSNLAEAAGALAIAYPVAVAAVAVMPVAAVTIPIMEPDERARQAIRDRNAEQWAPAAHAVSPSVALVAAELRFHLPPSARGVAARDRVEIKAEGGSWFTRQTLDIVVIGDFTPARLKRFLEAAERLHGHLEPAPRFRIRVFSDAEASPLAVGVFEFS